ncbi:hypothetical protein V6N12_047931 [Hibiscus sabdariffa]|uniref:Uncharacterized protein n=1 Tax=Hibiscus sabdariffa TaxID=183260 RepID=A0ABR2CUF1_9ROSI
MKDDHVGWDSTFNADCLGKGLHHSSEFNKRKEGSFVGEIEQKGGEEVFKHQDSTGKRDEYVEPKIDSCKLNLNDVEDARQQFSKQNESMGNCCSQVVEKLGTLTDVGSPLVNQGVRLLGNSRAVLDASCMGFKQAELIGSVNNILDSDLEDGLMPETLIPGDESLSWEERVDRLNGSNPGNSSEARDITGVETEMERGSMMEFPEFQVSIKQKGRKRYGSLFDLHDQVLSKAEKKKKDRALRRKKKVESNLAASELDGRSLTDSDLQTRKYILTLESRKALELGKDLGIQSQGDEEEVIRDLVRLEEEELNNKEV